jgi:hypothetical protein
LAALQASSCAISHFTHPHDLAAPTAHTGEPDSENTKEGKHATGQGKRNEVESIARGFSPDFSGFFRIFRSSVFS